ncbi:MULTISPECIES: aldo/keto reductase [Mesorhizobium]|uniref:aldo/keto reductase n=3 Tax=Phyllobacteriaceae TaxID=69277 RepID=UPI0007A947D4|nr:MULTISPECIES: aldo/keto reductase [Mesorhizobium]AMX97786.1 aldo/keto reductase [Mesorhizobium ciceri]MDF3233946.1 aldo/keto reductase [Mesorhizobium sp. DSM 30133]RUU15943.1 aldo/keto reductase [Mesorhizobium sp. Primo-B]RUU33520.1 aldo/keto reductase [Mesorhizobium sp. Primo-A]RVB81130.1 aldo/keto reductase [Mesorhizobium sp. M7A.F.Ca.AU.002.03.1.1]
MQARKFGRTGTSVSEVGFGSWAIGAAWGEVNDDDAVAALHAALDAGVTFIDTADVYGDGRSEKLIARVMKERGGERPFIATKAGKRLPSQTVEGFNQKNLADWVDRSLKYLEADTLDLVQLHCPLTDLYYHPEVFERLDRLVEQGKIRNYGVSVERVEEALKAMQYPGVVSVQIIFNAFRQRPAELFFDQAKKHDVAIIARVPLASGLLSGKFKADTKFETTDHRLFNRNGEAFDVGETFSGVPYEVGLAAVERIRPMVSGNTTMAKFALRWILMFDAVSVVIPGARNPTQARSNAEAADLPRLSDELMGKIRDVYDQDIKPHVHQRW